MDNIFANFSDYLLRIGFLTNSNIQDFRKIYFTQNCSSDNSTMTSMSEKFFDSILIKDKIATCIVDFLNLLTNDRKKLIGLSLFSRFYELCIEQKIECSKFFYDKYKILKLIPYFSKWRNNIFLLNHQNNINNNSIIYSLNTNNVNSSRSSNNINISFNEYLLNKKIIDNKYSNKKNIRNAILPNLNKSKSKDKNLTLISKEQEELKECTFKPKINNYTPFTNNSEITTSSVSKRINKQIIDKLYSDNKRRIDKREMELQSKNKKDEKENTFQPVLISKTPKNLKQNFEERLKNFDNQKNINLEKLRENNENIFINQYTFSPDISKSQRSVSRSFSSEKINLPIHERLYQIGEEQKRKKLLKEKEINLQIKNSANSPINKNKDNINKLNSSVDYKKIEELYNDYKKMQNRLSKKRADLDIEQGITFQPEIYTNRKYYDKIDIDFHSREENYLNKKQQNLYYHQNLIDEQNNNMSSRKKYSKKEKEEIANNIINRLYKEGVEKYKRRRSSKDIYEREIKDIIDKNNQYENLYQQDNYNQMGNYYD